MITKQNGHDYKSVAFLAHWVESWNWLLWWVKDLHKHPENVKRWCWLWPVYFLASVMYLIGNKPFNIVDRFIFKTKDLDDDQIGGLTVLLRNFGWHFFLPMYREKIRQRILATVLAIQDQVDVIGLGALAKDERVTQGGKWIVDQLGDRLRKPIVHGDTLTATAVLHQILAVLDKYSIKSPVFLTGSTSKIGRVVSIGLAQRDIKVMMYTQDEGRFKSIAEEAGAFAGNLKRTEFLSDGNSCSLWVTGKAIPSGADLYKYIPRGAVVMNFSVPNPLKKRDFRIRLDIRPYEGGLLAYNPEKASLQFTMRLKPGLIYACYAGAFVHCHQSWIHHEIGSVDMSKLDEVWNVAEEIGFFLPPI